MKRVLLLAVIAVLVLASAASAQDLEPRAFSQAPVGMNFAALSYGYATGEVLFDQATTITEAQGRVSNVVAAYVRTLGIWGASAKLTAAVPYAWGHWNGFLDGEYADATRSGLSDPQVQLAVNFFGAPAISMSEMKTYTNNTVLGASLKAVIPLGQYDSQYLINLGQNRWAFRPRVGLAQKMGRLTVEAMADAWLYTENPDFFGGSTVTQDPLFSFQLNFIYQSRRGYWFGLGGGLSRGGKTASNGVYSDSYKKNTRWAAIVSLPLTKRYSMNVLYIDGLATRLGSDFDKISVSFQMRWGGEK